MEIQHSVTGSSQDFNLYVSECYRELSGTLTLSLDSVAWHIKFRSAHACCAVTRACLLCQGFSL